MGVLLALPVALLAGSASALFLVALDQVIHWQWAYPWLMAFLPLAGVVVGLLYHRLGRDAEKGNNLLIDEIHQPGGGVPLRMAPLVLLGTLVTHLFGGSAGREGTAVQMGGSLADGFCRFLHQRLFRITPELRRLLLMSGVAAGFGSVFGTPLAGAVFAMEVIIIGRLQYDALLPVLVASLVGDAVCSAWGVHHTVYHFAESERAMAARPVFDAFLLLKVALSGILFGWAARFFAELTHRLQAAFARLIAFAPWRPLCGGLLVLALVGILGTRDYLGLGVQAPPDGAVSILTAFQDGGASSWSWLWKSLFTAITLASGFKGGEVTPLFFIGATLGNTLAVLLHEPVALFAALGFIAVFAGAANTPFACILMGMELFGAHDAIYYAVACIMAYHASGHGGIYLSQRLGVSKLTRKRFPTAPTLRDRAAHRPKR